MGQDLKDVVQGALSAAKGEVLAGRLGAAREICAKILHLDSNQALAHRLVVESYRREGLNGEAVQAARAYSAVCPEDPDAWFTVGDAQLRYGALAQAEAAYGRGLELQPGHEGAGANLALVYMRQGELGAAVELAESLVVQHASSVAGWRVLGAIALSLSRFERAVEAHESLVRLAPEEAAGWVGLGLARKNLGTLEAAYHAFDHALAIEPANAVALFGRYLALPIVHDTEAGIRDARQAFGEGLDAVEKALVLTSAEGRAGALEACLSMTNFYLHYQGYNDLELQQRYGRLVQKMVSASFPDLTQPLSLRSEPTKIKVGFISANFHWHSIYKTHGGFITHLDRASFEITTIHLGAQYDDATRALQAASDQFFHWPHFTSECVAKIAGLELDAIVYPDLGMEPITQSLATLRLAPVQCNAGGHPITSGLDTVDYFLSSDMMEASGAEAHYSETLVRLPNLFTAYPRPATLELKIPEKLSGRAPRVRFVCLQSLYKLLPQFDWVYAELLERVDGSELCFIMEASERVTGVFRARIERALEERGLSLNERVVFLPRMSQEAFYGLASSATVILDSFLWSGNNSSMEASWHGRPIVSWPGPMMRGRHTAAILERLGLGELIAKDLDDYVERAVRLAEDESWRSEVEEQLQTHKESLFEDTAPVRAFEGFLKGLFGP